MVEDAQQKPDPPQNDQSVLVKDYHQDGAQG